MKTLAALFALLLLSIPVYARNSSGFELSVLMDDSTRPEYQARGTVYVEAVRGREFSLRITNPTPYRVAVALSVDGLNTIDAKHTAPMDASKWILDPYESTVISGWQVSGETARRFFFTGEKNSYGAALGKTDNLGVIEAVFYRERQRPISRYQYQPRDGATREEKSGAAGATQAAPAPALSDDYAATGMGDSTQHEVTMVDIDLDPHPLASLRIRYEFHPQLVKLGVLPRVTPLDRREHARGFEGYCPQVN